MNKLADAALDEINQIVVSTLGLSSSAIVTKATKFVRFDWRSLIELFKTTGHGISAPYCIIRPAPTEEEDWGMAAVCWSLPIEIFLVEDEANFINTTTSTNGAGTVKTIASTSRMFVGQKLYFATAGVYGRVLTVDSGTQITLEASVTTTAGESVISDITSDLEVKCEKLRYAFKRSGTYTNFQVMIDPQTDVSDLNPANEYYEENNYMLIAGSCFIKILIGEIL